MTNVKLFDVFCLYQKILRTASSESVEPQRMDVTQPAPEDRRILVAHLLWACEEGKKFVEQRRFEKAMRWLGFIQGCLFARGHFTIDELGNHSRPPEPPFTTNFVSEVMRSCALKREAVALEETEARQGCSHTTEMGQSALRAADPRGGIECSVCERMVRPSIG